MGPANGPRTFAQLARRGGIPLEQIQLSLGHVSIRTTEVYGRADHYVLLLDNTRSSVNAKRVTVHYSRP